MKLTGHLSDAIYRRYNIVSKQDLEDGMGKLADYMEEQQGGGKVLPFKKEKEG